MLAQALLRLPSLTGHRHVEVPGGKALGAGLPTATLIAHGAGALTPKAPNSQQRQAESYHQTPGRTSGRARQLGQFFNLGRRGQKRAKSQWRSRRLAASHCVMIRRRRRDWRHRHEASDATDLRAWMDPIGDRGSLSTALHRGRRTYSLMLAKPHHLRSRRRACCRLLCIINSIVVFY